MSSTYRNGSDILQGWKRYILHIMRRKFNIDLVRDASDNETEFDYRRKVRFTRQTVPTRGGYWQERQRIWVILRKRAILINRPSFSHPMTDRWSRVLRAKKAIINNLAELSPCTDPWGPETRPVEHKLLRKMYWIVPIFGNRVYHCQSED
ncbi:unnamed protein product [Nesidiocoris tenuis]|uniref:Uncharacterized protein n=1 Tax=Nesidiocoris tenuis TaxID=355587 RepID=A0A6H5H8I9_9HEMI|nr:unnamed protein product [Nesidiocoris tenuis]